MYFIKGSFYIYLFMTKYIYLTDHHFAAFRFKRPIFPYYYLFHHIKKVLFLVTDYIYKNKNLTLLALDNLIPN